MELQNGFLGCFREDSGDQVSNGDGQYRRRIAVAWLQARKGVHNLSHDLLSRCFCHVVQYPGGGGGLHPSGYPAAGGHQAYPQAYPQQQQAYYGGAGKPGKYKAGKQKKNKYSGT